MLTSVVWTKYYKPLAAVVSTGVQGGFLFLILLWVFIFFRKSLLRPEVQVGFPGKHVMSPWAQFWRTLKLLSGCEFKLHDREGAGGQYFWGQFDLLSPQFWASANLPGAVCHCSWMGGVWNMEQSRQKPFAFSLPSAFVVMKQVTSSNVSIYPGGQKSNKVRILWDCLLLLLTSKGYWTPWIMPSPSASHVARLLPHCPSPSYTFQDKNS